MRMFSAIRRCKQLKLAAAVQVFGIVVWAALLQGFAGPIAWVAAAAVVFPGLAIGGAQAFVIGVIVAGLATTMAQAAAQTWATAAVWPGMWVITSFALAAHCAAWLASARALLSLAACSQFELDEMRLASAEKRLPHPDAAFGGPGDQEFWSVAA